MLYAIIGEDAPGSLERRLAARPAHLERVRQLQDEGRVVVAGPFPAIDSPDPGPAGFRGSLTSRSSTRSRRRRPGRMRTLT